MLKFLPALLDRLLYVAVVTLNYLKTVLKTRRKCCVNVVSWTHFVVFSGNAKNVEQTHAKLRDCDIQHASHHNQCVKRIPGIDEIMLRRKE